MRCVLPQLFGFVFACYVSKVFLEEEDSCESGTPREVGNPMSSAPWTGARAGGSPGSVKGSLRLGWVGTCIAGPFWIRTRCPGAQAKALPHYPPLRPHPVPSEGSTASLQSSTTHSQFVPLQPLGRSCLPARSLTPTPQPSALHNSPPHLRSSSLSQALAHPSGCYSKAQPRRPCTLCGLRFLPFKTQPPITSPIHRIISLTTCHLPFRSRFHRRF